jgi:RimJ/RimL family protein N-acetyltransferase
MITIPHGQEVLLTRQRHEADRAGLHYDVRMVIGDIAHSWATRKEMPEVGKSIVLWQQPIHTASYALSQHVIIPKGNYGSGVTMLDWVRKGNIYNPENANDKFVLQTNDGNRFLFKHVPSFGEKAWLFRALGKSKDVAEDSEIIEKTAALKYEEIPKSMFDAADKEHEHMFEDWSETSLNKKRVGIHHEGELVGFFTPRKQGNAWRTGTIYVSPEHRGKGIGTKTITDFFKDKEHGLAYVEPGNKGSMGAFKKAGFKEQGSKIFYGFQEDDGKGTEYMLMKKENKYLAQLDKQASLILGALGTHLVQNVATKTALGSKKLSGYLADSFAQGTKGVVDSSFGAKAKRFVSGALTPDIAVAHQKAHEFGHKMKPLLDGATKAQQVGLRMLSQGRISDLKKYNLHNDPLILQAHKMFSDNVKKLPDMGTLTDKAKGVEKVFQDKKHPLASNILSNISRGKTPVGNQYKPGLLTSNAPISGALSSALVDPAGGALNTIKTVASSKSFNDTRLGGKISKMIENQFVNKPVKSGIASGFNDKKTMMGKIKDKAYELGVNPVSAHLKRTAGAVSDALGI